MSFNRKVVVYIGISLDGYIATKEDSLEWLLNTKGSGDNGLVHSEYFPGNSRRRNPFVL